MPSGSSVETSIVTAKTLETKGQSNETRENQQKGKGGSGFSGGRRSLNGHLDPRQRKLLLDRLGLTHPVVDVVLGQCEEALETPGFAEVPRQQGGCSCRFRKCHKE